jgi:signal transduction histidine kinase
VKTGLQKRGFFLFIGFTVTIILLLTIFELILVRHIIFQYEKQNIDSAMQKIDTIVSEYQERTQTNFLKITENLLGSEQPDYQQVYNFVQNKLENRYVVIYDDQQDLVYGQKWDLIDKYKQEVFRQAGLNLSGNFVISFGKQSFWVDYYSLFDRATENFYGIIITTDNFQEITPNANFFTLSFPLVAEEFAYSNFANFKNKLTPEVEKKTKELLYIRPSSQKAYGVKILYDIKQQPQLAICYHYQRNFNDFAQKSLLVSLLLIAGFLLLVIVFFGNWFSRQIFVPIQFISRRMQQIIKNPQKLEQIENVYQGELADMVRTFNEMERSLTQYRLNLEDYKIITENLDSGVFWLDKELCFKLCNKAMATILETPLSEILGKKLTDFINLSDKEVETIKSETMLLPNLEIEISGKKKHVILNTNALHENDAMRIVGILADITKEVKNAQAMERLELELIKSNRLADIGKKVEGIVHNINSPLNSILGYAQLIKKEQGSSEDLEKIIQAGKNISHQVKELLRKVREDDIGLQRLIDVNKLLQQELSFLQHNIYFKHHINLKVNLAPQLPKITAVYSDVSQAVANILNNAIEALENSAEKDISVTTYQQDNYVCIRISDSGEGIDPENQELIFQPNYTTKMSKTGSGFGLGLAITKNIIERYNGEIEIQSEKTKGSTFILKFLANKE